MKEFKEKFKQKEFNSVKAHQFYLLISGTSLHFLPASLTAIAEVRLNKLSTISKNLFVQLKSAVLLKWILNIHIFALFRLNSSVFEFIATFGLERWRELTY